MKHKKCERDYLQHIQEAIFNTLSYIDGLVKADFLEDTRTQQACIMNLLIIGEASTKLINEFPKFIENHQDIPWRSMRGMRNRIAHGYFDIDLDVVWDTINEALPTLLEQIELILLES